MSRRILISLCLLLGITALSPLTVSAYNPFGDVCNNTQAQNSSAVCQKQTSQDPIAGSDGILAKVTNIVSYVAGVGAIILIIVGSIRYITSGGDSDDVKRAKSSIMHALIGLAVIVLARTLILFVLSKFKP